jgi:hypothetical protein
MFRTDIPEQSYDAKTIIDIRHFWHGSQSDWNPIDSKRKYFLRIEGSTISQYKNVAIKKWTLKKDLVFSREYEWDNVLMRILVPVENDFMTPIGEISLELNKTTRFNFGYESELYFNKINSLEAVSYRVWFMRYLDAPQFVDLPEIIFRIPGYGGK